MTRRIFVLATAVILISGQIAEAAPITYNFEGTVTRVAVGSYIPLGVTVGEQIPISITVDPSVTYAPITSALFNNINETSYPYQDISIQAGSSISFLTIASMISTGFSLALTGAHNGALPTNALPASLNPGDFTGGGFSVNSVYLVEANSTLGYSGTINGLGAIAPVSEPSSLLLLSAGLVGMAWRAAQRRKIERA